MWACSFSLNVKYCSLYPQVEDVVQQQSADDLQLQQVLADQQREGVLNHVVAQSADGNAGVLRHENERGEVVKEGMICVVHRPAGGRQLLLRGPRN